MYFKLAFPLSDQKPLEQTSLLSTKNNADGSKTKDTFSLPIEQTCFEPSSGNFTLLINEFKEVIE